MSSPLDFFDRRWPGQSFVRHVLTLAGGTAIAQGIVVALLPLITRVYSPANMGTFGLYFSFIGFVSVASSLRYEVASVQARDDREAGLLVVGSLLVSLPMTLFFSGLLYWLIGVNLFNLGSLSRWVVFPTFLALFFAATNLALRYWLLRREGFALISQVLVAQAGARVVGQLVLGLAGAGWLGLVGGDVIGRIVGTGRVVRAVWKDLRAVIAGLHWRALASVLFAYREFPRFGLPSALIDAAATSLPVPLIARSFGLEAAGHFALVQRVLSLPVALFATSIAEVFHARIAKIVREAPERAVSLFFLASGRAALLGLVPVLVVVFFAEPASTFIFGKNWALAGKMARLMAPTVLAQFAVISICRTTFVCDGQRIKLIYDLVSLGFVLLVLVVGPARGWGLLPTVGMLSLATVVGYAINYYLLYRMVAGASRRSTTPA